MIQAAPECPTLTNDEIGFLLSLDESELEAWVLSLPEEFRPGILAQLWNFQTPKEAARNSLYEFIPQAWEVLRPGEKYSDNWHIRTVADHLEYATETPNYNLVLTQPPGTMKSVLISVIWPAWVWGPRGWPAARFFYASYSGDFAKRDSGETRNLVQSDWYQSNWPEVEIAADDNRAMEFKLTAGGWRIATGTGGRATGDHPHFIIGDDLNKASDPDKKFAGGIDWWKKSMSTRGRLVGSRRIVVGQRLRLNEVSQHCLNIGYDHLCLPMRAYAPPQGDKLEPSNSGVPGAAEAPSGAGGVKWGPEGPRIIPADPGEETPKPKPEAISGPAPIKPTAIGWVDSRKPGELLWPTLLPESAVEEIEKELGPIDAAAQLQQRPQRILSGGLFPRHRVTFMEPEAVPWAEIDRAVRYWDKAGGESAAADYSAGILIGRWRRKEILKYIVINAVIGKWNPFERDQIIEQTAEQDWRVYPNRKVELWIEKEARGGAGIQSAQISARDLVRFGVRFDPPTTSKLLRAKPFSSAWHAGNVIVVVGAWNPLYLEQLEAFTGEDLSANGIHDDCVDGSSGAANILLNMPKGAPGAPVGLKSKA